MSPADARLTAAEVWAEVERHDRYIRSLARRWWRKNRVFFEFEDARQEAVAGFLEAGRRFDRRRRAPDGRPIEFVTYAGWWVRHRLNRAVCRAMGVAARKDVAVPAFDRPRSLDYAGPGGFRLADLIAAREEPDRPAFPADFWDRIRAALPPRHWRVIELRFRAGLTQKQAGAELGVSQVWVGQVEAAALTALAGRVDFEDC